MQTSGFYLWRVYVCVHVCVYIYVCVKKAEHRRIDAFELWCWKRLLRVHIIYI